MNSCGGKAEPVQLLLIIEGEIATTQLIEQVLAACLQYGISYRKVLLNKLSLDDIRPYAIPLFIRCGDPTMRYWVDILRYIGRPYVYYIDDNFWLIEGQSELARYYNSDEVRKTLDASVRGAAKVLTNTAPLARFLEHFNSSVDILPPFFDFSLIEGIEAESTDEIRIGFAGSPSRVGDLELIAPVIPVLLKKYPSVVFEFAGAMPPGVGVNDRVRFFPHTARYSDFIKFQAKRAWAIGLAPLVDNEANRCKTNNKFREYGACGIAGVYSAVGPYIDSVEDGLTGALVENSVEAWTQAICNLVASPEARSSLGSKARDIVREQYGVDKVAARWAMSLREVSSSVHSSSPPMSIDVAAKKANTSRRVLLWKSRTTRLVVAYQTGGVREVVNKCGRVAIRQVRKYRGTL